MVKLYGINDSDSLEVKVLKDPVSREIQYNTISHIAYADYDEVLDQGSSREIDLDIGCQSEAEREALVDFVFNKLTRITFDDVKYMNAKYIGGSRNWPVTPITKLRAFTISLKVSALLYSFMEHEKAGDANCPNVGNHFARPIFIITASGIHGSFKISDGVRELTYAGDLISGDVVEVSFWKAFLNNEEVSQNLSGEYPQIPAGATTFAFVLTGIGAAELVVKYRDIWR